MAAIREFYKKKNIFITGATGFIGIALVEKLLRSFPEIGKLFLLVRSTKTQSILQRQEHFFKNKIFERLQKENSENFSKIVWVEGDINKENFGMSKDEISKLQKSINLIMHSAATVSFAEPLQTAINTNIKATNELLKMAEGCQNLECFHYVSTCYTQFRKSNNYMNESILKHPIHPKELINLAKQYSLMELENLSGEYLLDWPNTYTYTKNAAENIVASYQHGKFPIAICRLAIIIASYYEPIPFWLGNNWGFVRILMEANRGLELQVDPEINSNLVPVDHSVNGMIMSTFDSAVEKKFGIYNHSSNNNPITYRDAFDIYKSSIKNYPELIEKRKRLLEIKNPIPGSKEDIMLKKIQFFENYGEKFRPILNHKFEWCNNNLETLWDKMDNNERKLLPFNVRDIDWQTHFSNFQEKHCGTRKIDFNV